MFIREDLFSLPANSSHLDESLPNGFQKLRIGCIRMWREQLDQPVDYSASTFSSLPEHLYSSLLLSTLCVRFDDSSEHAHLIVSWSDLPFDHSVSHLLPDLFVVLVSVFQEVQDSYVEILDSFLSLFPVCPTSFSSRIRRFDVVSRNDTEVQQKWYILGFSCCSELVVSIASDFVPHFRRSLADDILKFLLLFRSTDGMWY